MDNSTNTGMNSAFMQNGNTPSYDYLSGIQDFANSSTNDDFLQFDPALFESADLSSSYSQQTQPSQRGQSNYNQSSQQRQSNSPALPQYNPPQPTFSPSHYGQTMYDPRALAQPSFDPRFMSRPSPSPGPYDRYGFQQPISYGSQNYDPRFGQFQQQQRQAPTPQQQSYTSPQTQPSHPYMNMSGQAQSQLPQPQPSQARLSTQSPVEAWHSAQALPYNYQENRQMSHSFVDPSMLTANGAVTQPSQNGSLQSRQPQPSPYFSKAGATVEPHSLQHLNMSQSLPALQPQAQSAQMATGQLQPGPQVLYDPKSNATKNAGAPKGATGRRRKDGSIASPGSGSSSDDLEIEAEEPEPEATPALLVVGKPTDLRGKSMFEAVQAVWSPRNLPAPPEKVRSGIATFGDTVRALRDAWKTKNEQLKKAEIPNSPIAANAAHLKADVAHYRQVMEVVMGRSLHFGHKSIVKRLGENQFTMSALYSFLLDRVTADDYDSTLVNSILKFAQEFETVDEDLLEKVKWSKILVRFVKKSTNDSKTCAQKILSNAKLATAKKKAEKPGERINSPVASANGGAVAGVKRVRDGENASMPATKKTAVKPASKPLALQHAERKKALAKENESKGVKLASNGASNATVAARPKVTVSAPPKANPFAALMSASKRPGTTNAERRAAATTEKTESVSSTMIPAVVEAVKMETVKRESPPLRAASIVAPAMSASSFLGYLADMDKPKETQTKPVEEITDETPEQRTKRVRKEARRRLRVTWKPEKELVETRLFTHDPDEETGHEDSMMRDAGDTGREGEMLKRHLTVEDDDDDDEDEEEDFFSSPSEIDFEVLDSDSRSTNFFKFGGSIKAESQCSEAQEKHESGNLMTTYTSQDRPDTPKELPSVMDDDDFQPAIDFGQPDEKVRAREQKFLALTRTYQTPRPLIQGNMDVAAALRAINAPQAQQDQARTNPIDLQRTLGMFQQHNQQSQPSVQSQPLAGIDLSKLQQLSQQLSQMKQAQQPVPQQIAQLPPTTSLAPNIAQLLAQMTGAQQNQSLALGNGSNPNPFPGAEDHFRKGGDGTKKKGKAPVGPDGKPLNYKTQVCSFWKEGKCIKGDSCTYRHDE